MRMFYNELLTKEQNDDIERRLDMTADQELDEDEKALDAPEEAEEICD